MAKKEKTIFEGQEDADAEQDIEIRINEKFAKKYHEKKRHEELQNLKNVDLSDDDDDESDSETEDEDGDLLNEELDKDISRTLKLIRNKDPTIYDKSITFFQANESDSDEEADSDEEKSKKAKKNKPLYYKDLVRQQVLAGDISGSESEDEEPVTTYAEEQQKLKGDFLKSLADAENDEEEELDGGLFTKRKKTKEEEEADAKEYETFKNTHAVDEPIDADAFLAKYLKSGAWKERKQVPSYEEIVGNGVDDDEDEEELDKADAFEHAYNFRFEEEGGGQIQTFSRNIEDSLRRKDDKRKIAREERKARKALERQKKEEELRRLKNLKQAEIQSKLDKIMALMGESSKTLTAADLDGDFDPEEHDRRMAQVFDDDYYGVADESKKPTWDDDDEIFGKLPEEDEDEEEADAEEEEEKVEEDEDEAEEETENVEEETEDVQMEEENDEEQAEEEEEEMPMTKEEMEAKKKQYLDELYALDYEDLIGDLPCRFKYREVPKNDYGLTTFDILNADDQELKQVVSLKRLAPYADREYNVNRHKVHQLRRALREKERRQKNKAKNQPAEGDADGTEAQTTTEETSSKKKRKRKGKKAKQDENKDEDKEEAAHEAEETNEAEGEGEVDKSEEAQQPAKKKRKHKKKSKSSATAAAATPAPPAGLSASRLESYRLKPIKK